MSAEAPRRLIVNWQSEAPREFLPVAELVVTKAAEGELFEFGYLEGVRAALEKGFQPFLAFPDLDRRYAGSALFPFFQNRVLPTTRPDYLDYVAALGLNAETASVVELLGRSEGRRHTDRIETVLAAQRDLATGRYVTRFLARSVHHVLGAENTILGLQEGNTLEATLDSANLKNPRARLLRFGDDAVGFVPDYLLADVEALDRGDAGPTFVVERINPPPHPAHQRILVRLDAEWPDGFEPYHAESFQPYRAESKERLAG